jgi:hypothetical protein
MDAAVAKFSANGEEVEFCFAKLRCHNPPRMVDYGTDSTSVFHGVFPAPGLSRRECGSSLGFEAGLEIERKFLYAGNIRGAWWAVGFDNGN